MESRGLRLISSTAELQPIAQTVVAEHAKQASEYRGGNERMLGFFVGKVMKATQGQANPQAVNKLLIDVLSRPSGSE